MKRYEATNPEDSGNEIKAQTSAPSYLNNFYKPRPNEGTLDRCARFAREKEEHLSTAQKIIREQAVVIGAVDGSKKNTHPKDPIISPQTPQTPRRTIKKSKLEPKAEEKDLETPSYLNEIYSKLPSRQQERQEELERSRLEHYHHGSWLIRVRAEEEKKYVKDKSII